MRRVATLVLGAFVAVSASAAVAGDAPYAVYVNGRPLDASHSSALERRGALYANVVRIVRAFDGVLTFADGTARVTIASHTLVVTRGSRIAQLDGASLRLPGLPFVVDGDLYVPLASLAKVAGAAFAIDTSGRRVLLRVRAAGADLAPGGHSASIAR